ncbi:MAG: hypothetical protein WAN50_01170 [Minisyncoccia bacterium]
MPRVEELKERIGLEAYSRIERLADSEVGRARAMPLQDKWRKEQYFQRKPMLDEIKEECRVFHENGLRFSPLDILDILFHYKLVFATDTEQEFIQRTGGGLFYLKEPAFRFDWRERESPAEDVLNRHFELLDGSIKERTLITHITEFRTEMGGAREFFEDMFVGLEAPFSCYLEDDALEQKFKELQPHLRQLTLPSARQFFSSPSIGFTVTGTETYAYLYASASLRAFLNLLRIAGFVHHGQIDFGFDVKIEAPTTPVFLGARTIGVFAWHEDRKEPWAKFPDGCLFRSFGYRGLSPMWLDTRTFGGMKRFIVDNKLIFDLLENPWSKESMSNVAPSLDILSSATQVSDLGAKLLLLYCCLEHLFVPEAVINDNVKYIVGAIHALDASLLPWFDKLYKARCQYAHRGFIVADEATIGLVFESVRNVVRLMTAKLVQH